jgi:SAM-dependent methyltransferase
MSNYADLIYPEDSKNPYPQKLANYIHQRFMSHNAGSGAKILDVGCCTGKALRYLRNCDSTLDLYGIDVRDESPEDVEFKTCNLEYESIPFDDNTFDFVYSKSVLEHVFNTDNYVSESMRVLKPGGIFIGLTPDWKSQRKFFWDDYTHVKPFTRKGLRDCLRMHNFESTDCEYFYQLPFTWEIPSLTFIPKFVSLLPDSLKWKNREQRNTMDRKLVRFSKEKMLLSYGKKPE